MTQRKPQISTDYAYIGSWVPYMRNDPAGITIAEYTPETGVFRPLQHILPELNCGAFCLDKERGVLYCTNERTEVPDKTLGGQVFALKIDSETGILSELSCSPSFGQLPSYCAVDGSRRFLIVSNHSGRNAIMKTVLGPDGHFQIVREYDETAVVLFPLDEEGRIEPPCDIVRHTGHGALPNQQNPHAHCVKSDPSGRLFAVCDKGNDHLYCYRIDTEKRKLVCCDCLEGVPGSSPRYCVFHPTLPYLYYNNETMSIVNMVHYDGDGKLTPVCTVSCMEDGSMQARSLQSDLCISPSGTFLFTLVRDNSTITVYQLDKQSGVPTLRQVVPCGSTEGGRGLTISPDGRYLHLASCPDAGAYTFSIGGDGQLTPMGIRLEDRAPSVIAFASR